jgi:hypothetical protein
MKCLVLRKSQMKVELESCDYRGFVDRFLVALRLKPVRRFHRSSPCRTTRRMEQS